MLQHARLDHGGDINSSHWRSPLMRSPSNLKCPTVLRSAIPPLLVVWGGAIYGVSTSQSLYGVAKPAGFAVASILFWAVMAVLDRWPLQYVAVPLTFTCSQPQDRSWCYCPWDHQWARFVATFNDAFFASLWLYVVLGTVAFGLLSVPATFRGIDRFARSDHSLRSASRSDETSP